MRIPVIAFLVCGTLAAAAPLAAQGTISTQGVGYPSGGESSRSLGLGGAVGDLDPTSPINPASMADWGRGGLFFQYSPERRSVSVAGGGSDNATIARFPIIMTVFHMGPRATLGISSTTLLDRTWQTVRHGVAGALPDTFGYDETQRRSGSINDLRVAGAWTFGPRLTLGVGADAFLGESRVRQQVTFTDTTQYAPFSSTPSFSFQGFGATLGAVFRPGRTLALGVSGRFGGTLKAYGEDTSGASVVSDATVPTRIGGSLQYTGIGGTLLAVSATWNGWQNLRALGDTIQSDVHDGWDLGAGAEMKAGGLLGSRVPFRIGVRHRTLPSGVGTETPTETSAGIGAGFLFSRDRGALDVALQRVWRGGVSGVSERAWILSVGLSVRP